MYLKRFVYDRLLDWKNEGGHSTLEVGGARQVGKTYPVSYTHLTLPTKA